MAKLGKLVEVEIRDVWKLETHFSDWLAQDEQMALLSEALDMDLVDARREEDVGDFSADILACEGGTERKVIIENQYGRTNHDHLGKLITYASGTGAKTVVWIVEEAREEHRAAIQWLNEVSSSEIGFFLVQITLLRIGDSDPAPQFTVLERPNDWAKATKEHSAGGRCSSETTLAQLQYFDDYEEAVFQRKDFAARFRKMKPKPQHWLNFFIGSRTYHLATTALMGKKHEGRQVGVEIYIGNDKALYHTFLSHKDEIEREVGVPLEWMELPKRKASRIKVTREIDWLSEKHRAESFQWLADMSIRFHDTFPKYDH